MAQGHRAGMVSSTGPRCSPDGDAGAPADRKPVMWAQPAHDPLMASTRPGLAKAGQAHHRRGWRQHRPQPGPACEHAGRKFSTTMSASSPAGAHDGEAVRMLEIGVNRFLVARLHRYHHTATCPRAACATGAAGRRRRAIRPLITSAPNSARMRVQKGPAISVPVPTP